jgi:hypothetical protein
MERVITRSKLLLSKRCVAEWFRGEERTWEGEEKRNGKLDTVWSLKVGNQHGFEEALHGARSLDWV